MQQLPVPYRRLNMWLNVRLTNKFSLVCNGGSLFGVTARVFESDGCGIRSRKGDSDR
jgi:hypothetical protein